MSAKKGQPEVNWILGPIGYWSLLNNRLLISSAFFFLMTCAIAGQVSILLILNSNFASAEKPDGAVGLFSKGGFINVNVSYIHPQFRYRIQSKNLAFVSSLPMAWVDNIPTAGPTMYYDHYRSQ